MFVLFHFDFKVVADSLRMVVAKVMGESYTLGTSYIPLIISIIMK